ncbi:hypothetical protein AC629_10470 [Bradyrhizobium sp. NAS80.1]|nr:hypothetical protein AC629_10470 [Bradyrhizobium sp. NAS80.1]
MAAGCYLWRKSNGWISDPAKEITETARLAQKAVKFGRDDAIALAASGSALALVVGNGAAGRAGSSTRITHHRRKQGPRGGAWSRHGQPLHGCESSIQRCVSPASRTYLGYTGGPSMSRDMKRVCGGRDCWNDSYADWICAMARRDLV